jgi:clan AA aspartic protease
VGDVHVQIAITNPRTGAQSEAISAVADTGATLSVIPAALLESLGIAKMRSVALILADGRRVMRNVGDVIITVDQESTSCRVIFGEPDDAALLGVTALEQLGLAVDPVQRRLVPTDFLLYSFS